MRLYVHPHRPQPDLSATNRDWDNAHIQVLQRFPADAAEPLEQEVQLLTCVSAGGNQEEAGCHQVVAKTVDVTKKDATQVRWRGRACPQLLDARMPLLLRPQAHGDNLPAVSRRPAPAAQPQHHQILTRFSTKSGSSATCSPNGSAAQSGSARCCTSPSRVRGGARRTGHRPHNISPLQPCCCLSIIRLCLSQPPPALSPACSADATSPLLPHPVNCR